MGKKGRGWFIRQNQIAYTKPAKYSEQVVLLSRLIQFSTVDLHLEMEMLDIKKEHHKAVYWCRLLHINVADGKMAEHPDSFTNLCRAIVYDEPGMELKDFDRRVDQIRAKTMGKSREINSV